MASLKQALSGRTPPELAEYPSYPTTPGGGLRQFNRIDEGSVRELIKFLMLQPELDLHYTITSSSTGVGGYVDVTLRRDGTYTIHFYLHNGDVRDFNFTVQVNLVAPNGMSFVALHSGNVQGSDTVNPRRDDDHTDNGNQDFLVTNWGSIVMGNYPGSCLTYDFQGTGLVASIENLPSTILNLAGGAVGFAVGAVLSLSSELGFHNLGIGGAFGVLAGVVVFVAGGGIVFAIVVGVAVGAVVNSEIQQRPMTSEETQFAAQVFGNSLPTDRIILTNMHGLGGRQFTFPGADNNIYLNLGPAFFDPLHYNGLDGQGLKYIFHVTVPPPPSPVAYPGEILIHELTHAWQIAHSSFLPGMMCDFVFTQAQVLAEGGMVVYEPGPPDTATEQNPERQAVIVEQWFGRNLKQDSKGTPESDANGLVILDEGKGEQDPYFGFIKNHIRVGQK